MTETTVTPTETITYMLHVQETGQTFPLPTNIATDDNLVKRSLASVIPYIDTARLERSEPKDGVITITVTKTHAPKGAGDPGSTVSPVITSLIASEANGTNAVIKTFLDIEQMSQEISGYGPQQILELKKQIEAAFKEGEKQEAAFKAALNSLIESSPQAAQVVPMGF